MNRVFRIEKVHQVPDGTWVAPFLNSKDTTSGLPADLFDGFSVAAGTIEPHPRSRIHVMPFVTPATFVLVGRLRVIMKDNRAGPYEVQVGQHEAVLTLAGTFFQLHNPYPDPCKVLYIVSPAYLFEAAADGGVVYDDAIVLDVSWEQLAVWQWQPPELASLAERRERRRQCEARLAGKEL